MSENDMTVYCTDEEAEALYFRRAETDAKGIAHILSLTVQRIYQLEKLGIIARTESGNFNICDTFSEYLRYKLDGEPAEETENREAPASKPGFFMEINQDTVLTGGQMATLLGESERTLRHLTNTGVLKTVNGYAKELNVSFWKKIDRATLQGVFTAWGEPDAEAERLAKDTWEKLQEWLEAVDIADHMKPSKSKWELHQVDEAWNAFNASLPKDFVACVTKADKDGNPDERGELSMIVFPRGYQPPEELL